MSINRKSLKPLILLLIDTHFHKILVFLLMVYNEKLQNVTKAITLKTLDFTIFLALFHKKLVFLLMVYIETTKCVLSQELGNT